MNSPKRRDHRQQTGNHREGNQIHISPDFFRLSRHCDRAGPAENARHQPPRGVRFAGGGGAGRHSAGERLSYTKAECGAICADKKRRTSKWTSGMRENRLLGVQQDVQPFVPASVATGWRYPRRRRFPPKASQSPVCAPYRGSCAGENRQ